MGSAFHNSLWALPKQLHGIAQVSKTTSSRRKALNGIDSWILLWLLMLCRSLLDSYSLYLEVERGTEGLCQWNSEHHWSRRESFLRLRRPQRKSPDWHRGGSDQALCERGIWWIHHLGKGPDPPRDRAVLYSCHWWVGALLQPISCQDAEFKAFSVQDLCLFYILCYWTELVEAEKVGVNVTETLSDRLWMCSPLSLGSSSLPEVTNTY